MQRKSPASAKDTGQPGSSQSGQPRGIQGSAPAVPAAQASASGTAPMSASKMNEYRVAKGERGRSKMVHRPWKEVDLKE